MISVAMTTYNGSRYLIKQLESIVNQTRSVDEVVIVDDHSSDDSCQKVRSFIEEHKCKNWKLIIHETNKGFIKSFEDAIRETSGEIIILCDHDDIWHNRKVEIIYNTFVNNKDIKALATSFWQIDDSDNIIPIKKSRNKSNNNLIRRSVKRGRLNKMGVKDISIYNISPGCTCAFSKKLMDYYFNIQTYAIPHDWKILFIAACLGGLYYLDIKTTYYRIYSSNTIGLQHVSNFSKRYEVAKKSYKEKLDMKKILFRLVGNNAYSQYINEIGELFRYRIIAFENKNVSQCLLLLVKSMHFPKFYETILFDMIVILKEKHKK